MASRRSRIKGIANIPQRRKTAVGVEKQKDEEGTTKTVDDQADRLELNENHGSNSKENTAFKNVQDETDVKELPNLIEEHGKETVIKEDEIAAYVRKPEEINALNALKSKIECKPTKNNLIIECLSDGEQNQEIVNSPEKVKPPEQQQESAILLNNSVEKKIENIEHNLTSEHLTAATSDECPPIEKTKPIFKRNFIKPTISNSVLQRRNKVKIDDGSRTSESESESVVSKKDAPKSVHFLLDEKNAQETGDVVYPPAPPSPNKINRSRIKVAPRLGQRRTSFSASESEDDNRKSGRHRNDSVSNIFFKFNKTPLLPFRTYISLT